MPGEPGKFSAKKGSVIVVEEREKTAAHSRRRRPKRPPLFYGLLALCAVAVLVLAVLLVRGLSGSHAPSVSDTPAPVEDTQPPVISGAKDLTVAVGESLSYRTGVTVTDDGEEPVQLQVDASGVNLSEPGTYQAVYWAEDAAGNRAEVTVTVTVVEAVTVDDADGGETEDVVETGGEEITLERVNELADDILAEITTSGMSQREKALAIYNYVHNNIKYVGTSDKSSWLVGAYVGFTRGSGDCYNYFACSKALLTRAGIPNVDLTRVGGNSRHYWQLVDVGGGYYHFDACPHPNSYPLYSFLLTEEQVKAYTKQCSSIRKNYYVYDYDACPVDVVQGTPPVTPTPQPSAEPTPAPTPTPLPTPTATAAPEPTPTDTAAPEVTPSATAAPEGSATPGVTESPAVSSSPAPSASAGPEATPSAAPTPTPPAETGNPETPAMTPENPEDTASAA